MKRFFRILCTLLAILFVLSACNGASGQNETTANGEQTTDMKTETTGKNSKNSIYLSELSVIRPQNTDATVVYAARTVSRTIGEQAENGVAPVVGTDLHEQTTPEILIGDTNRPETAEAKALLSGKDAFAILRSGNKLAVVGTTNDMTCYGVEYLIREVLPGHILNDSIDLAEDYRYTESVGTFPVVTAGKTDFRVSVSSAAMSTALMQSAQTVCKAFAPITGSQAAIYQDSAAADAPRDSQKAEILVGASYAPETYRVLSGLTYQDGAVAIEGNKIIIFGFSDSSIASAVELFGTLLTRYTSGKDVIFPEKLFLRVNDTSVKVSAPIYPSAIQQLVPVDGDGMMIYLPETSLTEFDAYADCLKKKGYAVSAENQLGESRFYTYQKGRNVINGGFDPTANVARVILEFPGAELPIVEETARQAVCDPLLIQVDLNNLDVQSGMSYVIRLRDGRFLVIDGGATDYDDAKQLCDILLAQNVLGGKPLIAAWFLTHAHGDHWQAFLEMAEKYGGSIQIQSVVLNLATPELFSVAFDTASKSAICSKIKSIPGVKTIYARTGQQYRIGNATIDVWLSPEDLFIGTPNVQRGNDASVIYRLTCEGQTTMFLADAEQGISDVMVKRYGEALQSDMMQISHHGYSYSDRMPPLFRCVNPDVVLWPSVDHWYHFFRSYSNNVELVANAKEVIPACHGTRILTLPYAAQPEKEYRFADGDVIYSQDFESVKNLYEVGWQMYDSLTKSYTTPELTLTTVSGDKGLLMKGRDNCDCSLLTFLCGDYLKNVSTYTVTMDLKVNSLGEGFALWYHVSDPMNGPNRALFEIGETGTFTLKLVITRGAGGTTRAYVDGSEAGTFTNAGNDLGPLVFCLKKANVFIGKVQVVAGAN